jgi:hypothetical protein
LSPSQLKTIRQCQHCNVMVDSTLQFGLECDCLWARGFWNSCLKCRIPIRCPDTLCNECC